MALDSHATSGSKLFSCSASTNSPGWERCPFARCWRAARSGGQGSPRPTGRMAIRVSVLLSGRGVPLSAHDDARSRKTRTRTAHDLGPRPGQLAGILHGRLETRTRNDKNAVPAKPAGIQAEPLECPAAYTERSSVMHSAWTKDPATQHAAHLHAAAATRRRGAAAWPPPAPTNNPPGRSRSGLAGRSSRSACGSPSATPPSLQAAQGMTKIRRIRKDASRAGSRCADPQVFPDRPSRRPSAPNSRRSSTTSRTGEISGTKEITKLRFPHLGEQTAHREAASTSPMACRA